MIVFGVHTLSYVLTINIERKHVIKLKLLYTAIIVSSLSAQDMNYGKYGIDTSNYQAPQGLSVGTLAPDFSGIDQEGNAVQLSAMVKQNPVVLIFYRGQWCPVCNRYLSAFQDSLVLLENTGTQVIAITPETSENIKKTIFKTHLTIPVLADTTNKIIKDYKVFFDVTAQYADKIRNNLNTSIANNNNQDRPTLPIPATYIINKDGQISWRQFDINYKKRASVKSILAHLKTLTD